METILLLLLAILGIILLIATIVISLAIGLAVGAVSGIYYGIKFCVVSIHSEVRSKFMQGVLYSALCAGILAPLGLLIYVIVMAFI